ncbi:hypothetical protein BN1318_1560005 [Staphylococcus capitis]|nr:hypothetical protein BN1318_1560005 [Staphylococcus capitis]
MLIKVETIIYVTASTYKSYLLGVESE